VNVRFDENKYKILNFPKALTFLKETKSNHNTSKPNEITNNSTKNSINFTNRPADTAKKETPIEQDILKASTSSSGTITNNNNNVTVESLLLSLDKIEKESENLLQIEKIKSSSNQNGSLKNLLSRIFAELFFFKFISPCFLKRLLQVEQVKKLIQYLLI
jgi:hypothetical protein